MIKIIKILLLPITRLFIYLHILILNLFVIPRAILVLFYYYRFDLLKNRYYNINVVYATR